jgi:hypothetical protein
MNSQLRRLWLVPVAALCCSFLANVEVARAAPTIDFNIDAIHTSLSPSISYAGGSSALIGSQIGVDTVVGLETSLFADDPFQIIGGILSFETGSFVGSVPGFGWQFSGGGSLSIVGGVDTDGDDIADFSGTLFTATFADDVFVNWFSNGFRVVVSALDGGQLNSDLASLLGIGTELPEGSLNLAFNTDRAIQVGDAFISTRVLSGDVAAVPEAGGLALVSFALLGGAFGNWYRRRKAQEV